MRRHLDFLNFCRREGRIEWRKRWFVESRTHCVPKFARKFFEKNCFVCECEHLFRKNSAREISTIVQKFRAAAFALIDRRIGYVFRIDDVIEYLVHSRRRLTDSISVTDSAVIDPGYGIGSGVDAAFAVV